MDQELVFVINTIQSYCNSICDSSKRNPPPGTNAANGVWARSFTALVSLQNVNHVFTDPNGAPRDIYEIYLNFVNVTNDSFNRYDVAEFNGIAGLPITANFLESCLIVINDILLITGEDEDNRKEGRARIRRDIKEMVSNIKNKGQVVTGRHANGWIGVDIKHSCLNMLNLLNLPKFNHISDPDALKVKQLFIELYKKLDTLQISNSEHWLPGEWQILFTASLIGFSEALEEIKD